MKLSYSPVIKIVGSKKKILVWELEENLACVPTYLILYFPNSDM